MENLQAELDPDDHNTDNEDEPGGKKGENDDETSMSGEDDSFKSGENEPQRRSCKNKLVLFQNGLNMAVRLERRKSGKRDDIF